MQGMATLKSEEKEHITKGGNMYTNEEYELQTKKWKYTQIIEEVETAIRSINNKEIFNTFSINQFDSNSLDSYPILSFYDATQAMIVRMNEIREIEVEAQAMLEKVRLEAEDKLYQCDLAIANLDEDRGVW